MHEENQGHDAHMQETGHKQSKKSGQEERGLEENGREEMMVQALESMAELMHA